MKIVKMLPVAMLVALVACESQSSGSSDKAVALESQSQRISYLLGMDNGKNIRGIVWKLIPRPLIEVFLMA